MQAGSCCGRRISSVRDGQVAKPAMSIHPGPGWANSAPLLATWEPDTSLPSRQSWRYLPARMGTGLPPLAPIPGEVSRGCQSSVTSAPWGFTHSPRVNFLLPGLSAHWKVSSMRANTTCLFQFVFQPEPSRVPGPKFMLRKPQPRVPGSGGRQLPGQGRVSLRGSRTPATSEGWTS